MTHRTTPTARICPNCDGFATVAITIGGRDQHGHLRSITANCPACHGQGTVPARRVREGARV
jgi:DnaJ-class molecular chaperone